ncbi:MAG: N-acyl homoserine lactonase family protein [Luminiphilus sp.]|nr:N-acyl homoserine lactonase family protein [Luminiphilus sp.]
MIKLFCVGLVLSLLMFGCSEREQGAPEQTRSNETAVERVGAPSLKLYTFDCGNIEVSDFDAFSSSGDYAGQGGKLVNTCYLIRHPEGDLIWDLGLPNTLVGSDPQVDGIFTLSLESSLSDQLALIGLSAADIEFLSISHSHFDHTGQAALFSSAEWLVHEDELEHMFGGEEAGAQNVAFTELEKVIFSENYDVFGDGSVVILEMPGHTPGHTALLANLFESGPVLLSGDLYHRAASRELARVPRFNSDEAQTRVSMAAFERLAKKLGARVIIQHEALDVSALPELPGFLN